MAHMRRTGLAATLIACLAATAQAQQAYVQPADRYETLAEVYEHMRWLAASQPAICEFVDITHLLAAETTHEGRCQFALRISDNVREREDEPAYLIVAAHHGDEKIGTRIALHIAGALVHRYGTDEEISRVVDGAEVWIAPVWNPDGYVRDTRLNARNLSPDAVGVDINRNYPFGWGTCGGDGMEGSGTYRGPAPASEPEVRAMIALAGDRRFSRVHDFHGGSFDLRVGYGCWTHPWNEFLLAEAERVIGASGLPIGARNSCCHGGDIHFHMSTAMAYAFLWETGPKNASLGIFPDRAEAVLRGVLLSYARPFSVTGHTIDATTGDPLVARIDLPVSGFVEGEHGSSSLPFGRFDIVLPPGEHVLEFHVPGYKTQSAVVKVGESTSEQMQVMLVPEG